MQRLEFIQPKFTGARFNDHTLPFDLLDDLSIYQNLLLQVAKDVYREESKSKRVPSGFGQEVQLKLATIEEGSALPKIFLAAASFMAGSVDTLPYFQQAQQRITNTISAADSGGDISGMLSPNALHYFTRIGKNLREDEVIDFGSGSSRTARLTQENRRKIVLSSPNESFVESELHIRGTISAVSKNPYQFTLQTKDGTKHPIPVSQLHYDTIEQAYLGFENNKRVLISCVGVYNKQNRLDHIKHIHSVTILEKRDVPTQLETFLTYEDGWMNGDGSAYRLQEIRWLSNQFDNYFDRELLLPFTFPTVEGGVQFEWKNSYDDATLEVDLTNKTGYLHFYNSSTGEEIEDNFDLSSIEGWLALNEILSRYFKAV